MVCNLCKFKFFNVGEFEMCYLIIFGFFKFEMIVGLYVYYLVVVLFESEVFVFIEMYYGDYFDWLMYNFLVN